VSSTTAVAERPQPFRAAYRDRVSNGSSLHARGTVDQRSAPARRLRDLMQSLAEPLGGLAALTEADRSLVRTAASLTVQAEKLQAQTAGGEAVDLEALTRVSNAQARVLAAIKRKTSPASPPLQVADIIARHREGGR
jgi:hypothetical protein